MTEEKPLPEGPLLDIPTGAPHLLRVLPGKYRIQFDAEPYIIIRMGQRLGHSPAAATFQHRNVMAKRYEVYHFKHYQSGGGKYWTRSLGVSYYIVLPKTAIKVVPEHGGSWPRVVIGGKPVTLNVSGGGGGSEGGWIDWIHSVTESSVDISLSTLKIVADAAMTLAECQAAGAHLEFAEMYASDRQELEASMAQKVGRKALKEGMLIQLGHGYSFRGGMQVIVHQAPRSKDQSFIATEPNSSHGRVKVTFRQIDWPATCRLNGIDPTQMEDAFNFLGPGGPMVPQAEDLFAAAVALNAATGTLAEAFSRKLLPAPVFA